MNEEKIKYIRGVEGRGEDVKQFTIKEMNANEYVFSDFTYASPELLFYVEEESLHSLKAESPLGKLLIEHGEEMFLEPKYKFNVGDKVAVKNPLPSFKYGTVVSQVNRNGEPRYDLECNGLIGFFKEADLEPYAERKVWVWDDLKGKPIGGYYICNKSVIKIYRTDRALNDDRNLAKSEEVAKSMLAMAQISQLMPHYGGEVTTEEWNNTSMVKYTICRDMNRIETGLAYEMYSFLAFHTEEQRDEFLENNEQLVKDYLMLD